MKKDNSREIINELRSTLVKREIEIAVLKKLNEGLSVKLRLALKVNEKNLKTKSKWTSILKKLRILRSLN